MLLDDDVVAHGQAQPCAFSGRLGGEEGVEYLLFHLGWNASAIVADADLDTTVARARGRGDLWLEIRSSIVGLALGHRIEAVRDKVEQHAGDFLREHLELSCLWIKVAQQRDVELRLFGACAMIGEIKALLDQGVDVRGTALAAALARVQQHVLDNGVGSFAMVSHLFKVGSQHLG